MDRVGATGSWNRATVLALLVPLAGGPTGCTPTVDLLGVFFPGWLVSSVVGVVASYGIVLWLGRRAGAQGLADSGLLFVGLVVGIALAVWWVFFSGF